MEESRLDVPDSETAGQSPEPEEITSDRSSATEGPELQRRIFEDFGGGPLILDP